MNIGGFQKNSLIDFPGTLACVVFTKGCNFKCPYCHNPELAAGSGAGTGSHGWDRKTVFEFLDKRKRLLEGVVITGGEPTLQPDLMPFIERVRAMGYKVKLDSNGTRPRVLERLLEKNMVDYIAMDIKTSLDHYDTVIKGDADKDQMIRNIEESIFLVKEKSPAYEFRTTCARPFISPEVMEKIGSMLNGSDRYVLQDCSRNVRALEPDFLEADDHFFSSQEIQGFRKMMADRVKCVEVR